MWLGEPPTYYFFQSDSDAYVWIWRRALCSAMRSPKPHNHRKFALNAFGKRRMFLLTQISSNFQISPCEYFHNRLQWSTPHLRQSTTSIRMQVNPSGGTSSRKGISTPDTTHHASSRRDKKKPSRPTTHWSANKVGLNMRNQDLVKINGPIAFPLVRGIVS